VREVSGRPLVAVIGTGGSIAHEARHPLDLYEYADHGRILRIDELLATVPSLDEVAGTLPIPFRELSSTSIRPADWLELNELIYHLAENPALTGIVVTHGTATLEETAYFLHLTLKVEVPVVVVGAQRPSKAISSDAALNLLDAIRTASAPEARGLGVVVVANNEIQAAREVTKTSTYRLEAFRTPDLGFLGYADVDGRIVIYRRPTRRGGTSSEFDVRGLTELPRVDITYSYAGCDGGAIDAMAAAGARAIVVAGMAPGRPSPDEARAADDARRNGVVMILSTRAGSGRVIDRHLLRKQGFVPADNLNPQKARVLAMLGLTRTADADDFRRIFSEY
jgi:L-asparaginase